MSSTGTSKALRDSVRARAGERCEYCTYADVACYASFNCDHRVPERAGGLTHEANLAWACPTCNAFKSGAETVIDPASGKAVQLFNPRRDDWSRHFKWSPDKLSLVGKTPKRKATVTRLKMNRPTARAIQTLLIQLDPHPPT